MHLPFCSRVNIFASDERYCWSVDGATAAGICVRGMGQPVTGPFTAFIKTVVLTVDEDELRRRWEMRWCRPGKPRPDKRPPQSSAGGGDLGLAPLIGRFTRIHFGMTSGRCHD